MNADILLKHFDRIAEAPDAVAQLRRFVLGLAVRGKLVEQDPEDEPAAMFLERVRSEKRQSGRAKTKLATSRDQVLPDGWATVTLGEYAQDVCTGPFGSVLHQSDYITGGIPLVNPSHMIDGLIVPDPRVSVPEDVAARLTSYRLKAGDVVMARRGEVGRAALVAENQEGWLCGTGSFFLRFSAEVNRPFFLLLLRTAELRAYLAGKAVGTTMVNLNRGILKNALLAIPPLAEQDRIVAKVDDLMALCDRLDAARNECEARRDRLVAASLHRLQTAPATESEAHDCDRSVVTLRAAAHFHLDHLPRLVTRTEHVQQLRQAIVDLAVRGKLVEQGPRDQSGSELVELLRVAKKSADDNRRARTRSERGAESVGAGDGGFPAEWGLTTFGEVLLISGGVTKGRKLGARKTVEVPYLRVANVQRGWFNLDVIKEIEIPVDELERYRLQTGDILLTEGGDWDKLGRAAVWSNEIASCVHQNHIFRARLPAPELLLPRWVELLANGPLGVRYFQSSAKKTTNLASINMTQLRSCPLPIPPTSEQHRIVAKVDELMSLCDQLEAQLTTTETDSRRLLEAVLREALAPTLVEHAVAEPA